MTTATVGTAARGRRGIAAAVLVGLLRAYQRFVSPLFGPHCRFYPTCSSYAVTALVEHGALRGSWLAVRRVSRCHPFHPGGLDPVPEAAPRRSARTAQREFARTARPERSR